MSPRIALIAFLAFPALPDAAPALGTSSRLWLAGVIVAALLLLRRAIIGVLSDTFGR